MRIPKDGIDKDEKTGMPPPSPESVLSSGWLPNCRRGLSADPLRKHRIEVDTFFMCETTSTCGVKESINQPRFIKTLSFKCITNRIKQSFTSS